MPKSYKLKDALANLGSQKPFSVNVDGIPVFECLRLLCGTIDLENKTTKVVIKPRYCHLTEAKRRLKKNSISEIILSAFDGDLTKEDTEVYLNKAKNYNKGFWDNLKGELTLAIAALHNNEYLICFLHIYRLIEMVSVALPLFYAGSEHDYLKALQFLKELPQNPRDGDLAIFKKFIEVVAKSGGYGGHVIKVFYSTGDLQWDNEYTKQIECCIITEEKLKATIDKAGSYIAIPFSEFVSFFASFRNRLFHNTLSKQNFDIDALKGADLVCRPIVKPALNWFTLVVCVIIEQNASRYI